MMATTPTKIDAQGNDGSFSRLFRYISGGNESNQKVTMTTPVFMKPEDEETEGQMGFVLPKQIAMDGVPDPNSEDVRIEKRSGGKFAVYRFAGRMDDAERARAEKKLRKWMESNGLSGDGLSSEDLSDEGEAEFAGYDPPWTPRGPLRRNEVLIKTD